MKIPKKLLIIPVLTLAVVGTSTAFALQPDAAPKKEDNIRLTTVASEPTREEVTAPIETSAPANVTSAPTEPEPAPPAPKSTDELKDIARKNVISHGSNAEQADCYVQGLELRYGWQISEEFIASKADELRNTYVAMCPALDTLKKRGSSAAGFRD